MPLSLQRSLLVLLFGIACSTGSGHAAQKALTIVYGADYKPFAWREGQVAMGVQRDFVEAVLEERMGIEVRHEAYPWSRAQLLVEQGIKDGFFTVLTEARTKYTRATKLPFYITRFLIHTRRDNPYLSRLQKIRSLKDLEAMTDIRHIHMLGSGWHQNALENMRKVNQIVDAGKIPLMLANDRADVYIEQGEMFRHQAWELGVSGEILTLSSPVIDELGWHLFIGKKSGYIDLMPRINKKLEALEQSGELLEIKARIFQKYGLYDHDKGSVQLVNGAHQGNPDKLNEGKP